MTLRHALLGLLRIEPMSGYDLQNRFSQSAGDLWQAPDSQIYPELRKMEKDRLVEGEEQMSGSRRRRLYHITEAGERAFIEWINSRLEYQRFRAPAHLRAAHLASATPQAARQFFLDHIAHWEGELRRWHDELRQIEQLSSPVLVRRLAVIPESEQRATVAFKKFAYEGLVDHARCEIAWARRGLELVDSVHGTLNGSHQSLRQ